MKKIFAIASALFALSYSVEGQNNIVYGAGISYTNGTPTYSPGTRGAQIAIDTVTGYWYEYRTETSAWVLPGKKQSLLVVNACDSLYYYRSSAWRHLNPTGGGDPSITNEGILGVGAGAGTEARFYINGVYVGRQTSQMPAAVATGDRTIIVKSAGTTSMGARIANKTFLAIF